MSSETSDPAPTTSAVPDLPPSAGRVLAAAGALGLDVEVRAFPAGTRTAEDAAAAIGVDVGLIVKSLVFALGADDLVLALVSGAHRLDEGALARAAGVAPGAVGRAEPTRVRAATGYAIGGIPPLGHERALPCFVDQGLLAHPVVWAAAGTPTHVFAVEPAALVAATGATVASLAAP